MQEKKALKAKKAKRTKKAKKAKRTKKSKKGKRRNKRLLQPFNLYRIGEKEQRTYDNRTYVQKDKRTKGQ